MTGLPYLVRVMGYGSFAEYVCARADKPANLTFEQAAAVPISGLTALQGLRDAGGVQPGQLRSLARNSGVIRRNSRG
jgi:NADPH:quinone reductase-like Zn-dependent oxidoreductase